MITIYKTEKTKANYITTELRGLSSEDKPTSINENIIDNGSTFIEIDTGDKYMYDLENNEWYNISSNGGGGNMDKYDYFIDFGNNGLWLTSSSGSITDSAIVSQLNAIENDYMTNKKPLIIYIKFNDGQYTHLSPCTRIETEIDGDSDNEFFSRLVFDVTYDSGDYYLTPYNANSWEWGRQND